MTLTNTEEGHSMKQAKICPICGKKYALIQYHKCIKEVSNG